MNVKFVLSLLFGLLNTEIYSQMQRQDHECGKRLERGAVMCRLISEEENAKPFDFKLCTHALIYAGHIRCADNKCSFSNSTEFEEKVKWALPNFPERLGTLSYVTPSIEEYLLGSKLRRSNTINQLLKFLEDRGLSFLWLVGQNENYTSARSLPIDDVNFLQFVKELVTKFHARGLHVGLQINSKNVEEIPSSDSTLQTMSKYVDWYMFGPRNNVLTGFIEPWTPLTKWFEGTKRTYEYWIKNLLQFIPPECLVMSLGPTYLKYTTKDKAVDPGPGSIIATGGISHGNNLSPACDTLDIRSDCRQYWDEESNTPWAVCGDDVYTFDNPRSLRLKADLIKKYNITGLYFNTDSITTDNVCDGDAFARLKAIQEFRLS